MPRSRFLDLPFEIRGQILGEVFFPGEPKPKAFYQNDIRPAIEPVRQILPYSTEHDGKYPAVGPPLNTSIIRTCKRLQQEAEIVLYGSSTWNIWIPSDLKPYSYSKNVHLTFESLKLLPTRLRSMIQRVQVVHVKSYNREFREIFFEKTILLTFLAHYCPMLHYLRILPPKEGASGEGSDWYDHIEKSYKSWYTSYHKNAEWVHAVLRIDTLRYFNFSYRCKASNERADFARHFLPWLQARLTERNSKPSVAEEQNKSIVETPQNGHFPLLKLPGVVRDRIYRWTLVPYNNFVHPFLPPYFDETTQSLIPLFLTNKKVYQEAECVLYREAIFRSPARKYEIRLREILEGMYQNLLHKISPPGAPRRFAVTLENSDGSRRQWRGKRKRESTRLDAINPRLGKLKGLDRPNSLPYRYRR